MVIDVTTTRKQTLIRINVRPSWHQRTLLAFDSPELLQRMEDQARLAMRHFEASALIEVLATCGPYSRIVRLERPVVLVRIGAGRSIPAWA